MRSHLGLQAKALDADENTTTRDRMIWMIDPGGDALSVRLRDGRSLSYADRGDPSGKPLLYFHGNPGSRLDWSGEEYERLIVDAGVRWVAIDRPGFGRSDFAAPTSPDQWADDIAQLMDALELARAPILAFSRGSLFALGCAALIPDRVTGAGLLSPVAPGDWPGMVSSLRRDQRLGLSLFRRSERLGRAVMARPVARTLRSEAGTIRLLNRLLRSPLDHDLVKSHAADFWAGAQEAFRQGPAAYVSEARTWADELSFDLASVRTAVALWHGEEDRLIPVSHSQRLAERLPNARLHVIANEAHLHPPHVLADIASDLVAPPKAASTTP
jgi:pimeloyl-ACP methyl ester carboxylesterase